MRVADPQCGWLRPHSRCFNPHVLVSSSLFFFLSLLSFFLFCGEHLRERERAYHRAQKFEPFEKLKLEPSEGPRISPNPPTGISVFSPFSLKSRISRFFELSFETEDLSWYYLQTSSVSLLIDFWVISFLDFVSNQILGFLRFRYQIPNWRISLSN